MSVDDVGSAFWNANCANEESCDPLSNLNVATGLVRGSPSVVRSRANSFAPVPT